MKSWALFSHSVGMLVRNFGEMLRIFLIPAFLIVVFGAWFLRATGVWGMIFLGTSTPIPQEPSLIGAVLIGAAFLVLLLMILIGMWSVVAWHRFVLLEEMPEGWLPSLKFDRLSAYFGRSLQMGLVIVVIGFLVSLIAAFLIPVIMKIGFGPLLILQVAGAVLVNYLILRMSLILPAAALGTDADLIDAWEATEGETGDILGLAALLFAVQFIFELIAGSLDMQPALSVGITLISSAGIGLLNVSILTTLYGHYVEGRPV